jgi:hypothetical protein
MFSEEIHLGDPHLAKTIADKMAGYIETLGSVIAAGIKNGEFRPLSPRETAITLLGMIQFTALRWSITRGAFNLDAEANRLWDNFLRLTQSSASPMPAYSNPMGSV